MSLLERPFVGAISAWPSSMDGRAVLAHKSRLIVQGDFLASMRDDPEAHSLARCLYRGAAIWEQWLVEHTEESAAFREKRLVSALSLAERAGDWKCVHELLDLWVRLGFPAHRRFYRGVRTRAARAMPGWQHAMQQLRVWDDRARRSVGEGVSEAERVAVEGVLHTLDAAHLEAYTRGRLAQRQGHFEEAARWFVRACLADPREAVAAGFLGLTYAQSDPRRALALWDEAAPTLGGETVYRVLRARFAWMAWMAAGRTEAPPLAQARDAVAAVAARRAALGRAGDALTAGLDALATLVLSSTLAAQGEHAEAQQVLEAATIRLPGQDTLRAARAVGGAVVEEHARWLEQQCEDEMERESLRLLAA